MVSFYYIYGLHQNYLERADTIGPALTQSVTAWLSKSGSNDGKERLNRKPIVYFIWNFQLSSLFLSKFLSYIRPTVVEPKQILILTQFESYEILPSLYKSDTEQASVPWARSFQHQIVCKILSKYCNSLRVKFYFFQNLNLGKTLTNPKCHLTISRATSCQYQCVCKISSQYSTQFKR